MRNKVSIYLETKVLDSRIEWLILLLINSVQFTFVCSIINKTSSSQAQAVMQWVVFYCKIQEMEISGRIFCGVTGLFKSRRKKQLHKLHGNCWPSVYLLCSYFFLCVCGTLRWVLLQFENYSLPKATCKHPHLIRTELFDALFPLNLFERYMYIFLLSLGYYQ